jgi:hypothetical protein
VVTEADERFVKGLPYNRIDNGKVVYESGQDAAIPVVGQSYYFIPTKATEVVPVPAN